MKEIQENSILVRIKARLEFIGNQLRDPSFFYQVRGVSGISAGGARMKKYGLKGGSKENILGFKGESPKKSLKFCSDDICNYAKCQKLAFLTFRNFKFSQGSMPPDTLLYYAPKGNSTPLKCKKE